MKEPCLRVQELTAQAQALIDSNKGVNTQALREALGVNAGMFKHITRLLRCVKERNGMSVTYHRDTTYIPSKPQKSTAHIDVIYDNAAKIQTLVDKNLGITGLQMRIELGMELKHFTKAIQKVTTHRAKIDGLMVYYKTEPKPIKSPPSNYIAPIFTAGEKPRTIWRTEIPWQNTLQT
jgi:hypothetical protein